MQVLNGIRCARDRHSASVRSKPMTFCVGIKVTQGLVALADTQIVKGGERLSKGKLTLVAHRAQRLILSSVALFTGSPFWTGCWFTTPRSRRHWPWLISRSMRPARVLSMLLFRLTLSFLIR